MSHRQTWLFSSTSTYHSADLLTACGVAYLVVHGTSGSTSYERIPPVPLETSGDVLSTVDMVVQRRDGPRWLRELDDDDILMQWSHETMFAIVIFEICRQLLGASPPDPTGAPPLGPAGRLPSPDPLVLPPVASLPALGPWAPPAERGPLLESIYRVSVTVGVCKGNKIFGFTKFISPQPVGGP